MAVHLSPVLQDSQFDSNGQFLVNGRILTRLAGTSTNYPAKTDSTGLVNQTNPILLNARGEPANELWLDDGITYDLYLQDSNGNTIRTYENIRGVNDNSLVLDEWTPSGATPEYINANQFAVPGDRTSDFSIGRRIKVSQTSGTVYGRLSNTVYGTKTTNTVVLDGGAVLDSGISSVQLAVLRPDNPSYPVFRDDAFLLMDESDKSKLAAFQLNQIATGTKRTITIPDKDITLSSVTDINGGQQLGDKIQSIAAAVAANALTLTINPTTLDFRNTSLTTGVPNTRSVSAAVALTVPSGATLGTINAIQSRLVLLAIDNAGTVEAAVINLAGGTNLDETTLLSTTALSGSSNSANVAYSTTGRTNVPFRVVGYIDITEATAGTWATAPILMQGYGGQALASLQSLGYGQAWTDVTGSRTLGTTYYNTTGRPIQVHMRLTAGGGLSYARVTVSGVNIDGSSASAGNPTAVSAIVPPGASYVFSDGNAGGGSISNVRELR